LVFFKVLKLTTSGKDVYNVINDYFIFKILDWKKCKWACTDGAPSMAGKIKGLAAKMKAVSPNMQWNHCSIHREALACKKMPEDLKDVLNDCVKAINMIKAKALNSRLFTAICEEMGKDHLSLLLHTEVRWLSRGRALARFYDLRDEVVVFLERNQQNKLPTVRDEMQRLINRFRDPQFQLYLVDIFDKLNVLNACMQCQNTNVFDTHFKVIGMKHKLKFYIAKVTKGDMTILNSIKKNYKKLQKI
jgi:zinc finger BED domain-containing protein 5/7/8/9